jgi:polyisoprenoid-binding protein YceI
MRVSAFLLLAAAPVPAHAIRYEIDGRQSDVTAQVAFFGVASRTARFPTLHGGITLDPAHGDAVDLDVEIDARTLVAPDPVTLERLRGPRFFDVAHYPTIRFTGHRLMLDGDRSGTVSGEISARGVVRPATLQVRFERPPRADAPDAATGLVATAEIDRRAFGMTAYPFIVGRTVTIRIAAHMVAAR